MLYNIVKIWHDVIIDRSCTCQVTDANATVQILLKNLTREEVDKFIPETKKAYEFYQKNDNESLKKTSELRGLSYSFLRQFYHDLYTAKLHVIEVLNLTE